MNISDSHQHHYIESNRLSVSELTYGTESRILPHMDTNAKMMTYYECTAVTMVFCNMMVLVFSRFPIFYFSNEECALESLPIFGNSKEYFKENMVHITHCVYFYFSLSFSYSEIKHTKWSITESP